MAASTDSGWHITDTAKKFLNENFDGDIKELFNARDVYKSVLETAKSLEDKVCI